MGHQCLLQLRASAYSLHGLGGFGVVVSSRLRGFEGFEAKVSWEGASGLVAIVRLFFHRWNICVGSKPVPLILSHGS